VPSLLYDTAAGTTSTTITLTPEIGGSNTLLLVGWTGNRTNSPPTLIEYGGAALTEQETLAASSNAGLNVYYMLNPAAGQNLVLELTNGGPACSVWAGTIEDVHQTIPFSASTQGEGVDSTDVSYSIGSAPGEKVFDIVSQFNQSAIANILGATPSGAGQTQAPSTNYTTGSTNAASIQASYKDGETSVAMEWLADGSGTGYMYAAVSVMPASAARTRAVKYFHDINDPAGRIFDDLGRVVPPWELEPDNWIRVTGLFLPTSTKYASFTQDPELAYIEEVSFSVRGGLRIKTNRGEMTEVLLARAAGGKTL